MSRWNQTVQPTLIGALGRHLGSFEYQLFMTRWKQAVLPTLNGTLGRHFSSLNIICLCLGWSKPCCLLLLELSADILDSFKISCLCLGGSKPCCQLLLERSADPNKQNLLGATALEVATALGKETQKYHLFLICNKFVEKSYQNLLKHVKHPGKNLLTHFREKWVIDTTLSERSPGL